MDKALSFLGLCKKAGALEAGEEKAGAAVKKGKAALILTASDAAQNALKRAENYAVWANARHVRLPYTKDELADLLSGKVSAIVAVTDRKMAKSFLEKLAAIYGEYAEALASFETKRSGRSGRNHHDEV